MDVVNIIPGVGVGPVRFGINEGAALDILGPPADREVLDDEVTLVYLRPPVQLSFLKDDDYLLSIIEVVSFEGVAVQGVPLTSLVEDDVIQAMEEHGYTFQCEDLCEHERVYQDEESALSVYFDVESSMLTGISVSPVIDGDDVVRWPTHEVIGIA